MLKVIRVIYLIPRAICVLIKGVRFSVKNSLYSLFWDYQTCTNCGRIQRVNYSAQKWEKHTGAMDSSQCIDCYVGSVSDDRVVITGLIWKGMERRNS